MMPDDRDTVTRSLSPERFARLRALFEAALDRPVRERRAYLEGACGSDKALLEMVEGMLAAEGKGDAMLDGPVSSPPSSTAHEEGRFPAGTALAGRYRILGMLGRGGMGEVYKAFDLILNQIVALKFLNPAHLSEAALARFRNEVRIARQVSHPNVCRVYDLGMVEGLHFLSMEYIDGEDLASLLRRIGRLPQDKAMEFTRKICAGLGAAHERGVLHRDLKPANIMIDGRGQPRITDFGLAGLAAEIPLSDLRSGTPAYMSPEQKAGREVTTKSDLYSLGLVMYEMFTGKTRKDTQSSPSEIVKDLDPAIERVILRCLDEEPKRRPSTALSVAMGLPGGDPIAAALAAGETPSPEMVAASQEKEGFSARTAVLCFVLFIAALLGADWAIQPTVLNSYTDLATPPDAMAYRAREILKQLGYVEPPARSLYGFDCCDQSNLDFVQKQERGRRDLLLANQRPSVVSFWYRQHRGELWFSPSIPRRATAVGYDYPENTEPGMIRLLLDGKERLIALEVQPWDLAGTGDLGSDPGGLWGRLFEVAGLDRDQFTPVEPRQIPPTSFDVRASWEGPMEPGHPEKLLVHAASWKGRPVFFAVDGEWHEKAPATSVNIAAPIQILIGGVLFMAIVGAALTARHNLRSGRGDRRGAAILASTAMLLLMGGALLRAHHVASFWELGLLWEIASLVASAGATLWLAYMAVEPYMRRNWPDSLISWTRLQAGCWRDPLVASHVLIGMTAMMCGMLLLALIYRVADTPPLGVPFDSLNGPQRFVSNLLLNSLGRLQMTLAVTVVMVLLRLLMRKVLVADAVVALIAGVTWVPSQSSLAVAMVATVFMYGLLWVLRRYGLVAFAAAWLTNGLVQSAPRAWTGWYSGYRWVEMMLVVAIAAWALWVIVAAERPKQEIAA